MASLLYLGLTTREIKMPEEMFIVDDELAAWAALDAVDEELKKLDETWHAQDIFVRIKANVAIMQSFAKEKGLYGDRATELKTLDDFLTEAIEIRYILLPICNVCTRAYLHSDDFEESSILLYELTRAFAECAIYAQELFKLYDSPGDRPDEYIQRALDLPSYIEVFVAEKTETLRNLRTALREALKADIED